MRVLFVISYLFVYHYIIAINIRGDVRSDSVTRSAFPYKNGFLVFPPTVNKIGNWSIGLEMIFFSELGYYSPNLL